MTAALRPVALLLLTPILLLILATPSNAATRYVDEGGSFINDKGVKVCLFTKQVRSWRTLWLWDSRGLPVIGRCQ